MNRFCTFLVLSLSVSSVMADDAPVGKKAPSRPVGTWTMKADDGSLITLSVNEKSLAWSADMPGRGVSTLTAPNYAISDDGILFGYISEAVWTDGVNRNQRTDLGPFAFRLAVDEGHLTISNLRMFYMDPAGHKAMSGTYSSAAEEVAAQPSESKTQSR